MAHFDNARQQLVDDLHQVLTDMEDLVKAVATDSKEKMAGVKPRAEAAILRARARIADLEAGAARGLHAADSYAHKNPWQTAGVAAGVGAAIGAILGASIARR